MFERNEIDLYLALIWRIGKLYPFERHKSIWKLQIERKLTDREFGWKASLTCVISVVFLFFQIHCNDADGRMKRRRKKDHEILFLRRKNRS